MSARLADITRALWKFGVAVEKPKSGSHWKARKDGYRSYTLPAHNGPQTELDDMYIKGVCRNFGIDLEEFRALL